MNAGRLLAIDVGSREVGAAVFDSDELRYYAVKTFAKRQSGNIPAEAARVVRSLIADHQPFQFALAQPLVVHQASERVAHTIRSVKHVALQEGLALFVRTR